MGEGNSACSHSHDFRTAADQHSYLKPRGDSYSIGNAACQSALGRENWAARKKWGSRRNRNEAHPLPPRGKSLHASFALHRRHLLEISWAAPTPLSRLSLFRLT